MSTNKTKAAYELEIDGYKCRLKAIDRFTLKVAYAKLVNASGQMNIIDAGELILNSCWLEGDKEIKDNDSLWASACMKCFELIEQKEATLKKL